MVNQEIANSIRDFVLRNADEELLKGKKDPFWQNLKDTGTELWLDTGDIIEAEKNWSAEMTALTTNNTLLNAEIQKGIYDDFVLKAREIVKSLSPEEQILEIAFILNAYHGLRLAKKFGGFVSVELHTDTADDFEAIIHYGLRFQEICPDQFIVKVPYTATGLLGARRLKELGVRINFTLEFSARQNVLVATIAKPDYLNVFLGRIGAYIKDNGLGSDEGVGEKTVLSTQKWIRKLTGTNPNPTKLIAASLRNEKQLEMLAGVDVYTMPVKVAASGKSSLKGQFSNQLDTEYTISLLPAANNMEVDKLWNVTDKELDFAKKMDLNPPKSGQELTEMARKSGLTDMFPELNSEEIDFIANDGKIPVHSRWTKKIENNELAIDTLLNLAGLESFKTDQKDLDQRISRFI